MVRFDTPILHNVKLDLSDMTPQKEDKDLVSFQHPCEILFSHEYITSEIEKFDLVNEGCFKCNLLSHHFQDPRSNFDKLLLGIQLVKHPDADMKAPFPHLTTLLWEPQNISLSS